MRGAELILKEARGDFVHVEERGAKLRFGVGIFGALGHGDAVALGQELEGLGEGESVDFHDEFEDVAAGAAAEALVELAGLIDGEGRRFFLMKGAQADEASGGSGAFEAHVIADHFDDVDLGFELLDEVHASRRLV